MVAWVNFSALALAACATLLNVPLAVSAKGSRESVAHGGSIVRCAEGRQFFVRMAGARAIVTVGLRQISLLRRDLKLGHYFSSAEATLMIDGDFVAFVPWGDPEWTDCRFAR